MFTYKHIFLSFTLFTMLWIDIYVVSTSVIANGVSQNNDLLLPIGDPEVNSFASRSWMEDNKILLKERNAEICDNMDEHRPYYPITTKMFSYRRKHTVCYTCI